MFGPPCPLPTCSGPSAVLAAVGEVLPLLAGGGAASVIWSGRLLDIL